MWGPMATSRRTQPCTFWSAPTPEGLWPISRRTTRHATGTPSRATRFWLRQREFLRVQLHGVPPAKPGARGAIQRSASLQSNSRLRPVRRPGSERFRATQGVLLRASISPSSSGATTETGGGSTGTAPRRVRARHRGRRPRPGRGHGVAGEQSGVPSDFGSLRPGHWPTSEIAWSAPSWQSAPLITGTLGRRRARRTP